jgi:hypothetical protein
MRFPVVFAALALSAATLFASKKVVSPSTSGSNEQIDIVATLSLAEDEVAQKLGVDPGPGVVLVEVRATPKTDKPLLLSPDDFILLAHDDGERSQPFQPSEIAGRGALVVAEKPATVKKSSSMVGFGGMVGGGGGASPGNPKETTVTTKMDSKSEGNDKLLAALKAKQFPTKESIEPVEGFLYFPLRGKHKLKNMELLYRGSAGKLNLDFQH